MQGEDQLIRTCCTRQGPPHAIRLGAVVRCLGAVLLQWKPATHAPVHVSPRSGCMPPNVAEPGSAQWGDANHDAWHPVSISSGLKLCGKSSTLSVHLTPFELPDATMHALAPKPGHQAPLHRNAWGVAMPGTSTRSAWIMVCGKRCCHCRTRSSSEAPSWSLPLGVGPQITLHPAGTVSKDR